MTVTPEEFIKVWQTSSSREEVAERTGMSLTAISSRAWLYRKNGIKLKDYQRYYNEHRCHSSRGGAAPVESAENNIVDISQYRWEKHCRGLFQLPMAA